jgi:hypothetical protein
MLGHYTTPPSIELAPQYYHKASEGVKKSPAPPTRTMDHGPGTMRYGKFLFYRQTLYSPLLHLPSSITPHSTPHTLHSYLFAPRCVILNA